MGTTADTAVMAVVMLAAAAAAPPPPPTTKTMAASSTVAGRRQARTIHLRRTTDMAPAPDLDEVGQCQVVVADILLAEEVPPLRDQDAGIRTAGQGPLNGRRLQIQ